MHTGLNTDNLPRPRLVVHADWSLNSRKRWMAMAVLDSSGNYFVKDLENAGDSRTLLARLRAAAGERSCVLVGFDFPIGLPLAYAQKRGITSFIEFLTWSNQEDWQEFFNVATSPGEISVRRPFYPYRPGSSRQIHLMDALGMEHLDQLRRTCELGSSTRRPACPLFWTMGGQQVGKAAIHGWRDVLIPALLDRRKANQTKIWPFSGFFNDLLSTDDTVIAETYPAEFYTHLGIDLRFADPGLQVPATTLKHEKSGKRSQASRKANAAVLFGWAESHSVRLRSSLKEYIINGFGPRGSTEDEFDALVGLFGMLNIILGDRPPYDPEENIITSIEGWILGQNLRQSPV